MKQKSRSKSREKKKVLESKEEKKKLQPIITSQVSIQDQTPTTATPLIFSGAQRGQSHSPATSERQIVHRKNNELIGAVTEQEEQMEIHFELKNHHEQ